MPFEDNEVICPNCDKPAPGGLYFNAVFGVEHYGCFWEGYPKR